MESSQFEPASRMAGLSPAHQRLEYFIAKCCDLTRLLQFTRDEGWDAPSIQTEEGGSSAHNDDETIYYRLVAAYCTVPSVDRQPEELPELIKSRLAQYCAENRYATDTITKAFGNWVALKEGITLFEDLRETCDPRKAASFNQLADQVYAALGFREEQRKIGLVAARQEVEDAQERLPRINLRDSWGLSAPIFSDAEDILVHLASFYARALKGMGQDDRKTVTELLKQSGSASVRNYRSGKMQFGNKIDVLVQVDQHIRAILLKEFQSKFGQTRDGIINCGEWEPKLRRLAIIRGATVHPDTVVDEDDLQEIRSVLSGVERSYFADTKLDFELNDDGDKIVRFDLIQIRRLLAHALDWLKEFYIYLADDIFPEVQFHERVEIDRHGKASLLYTDEEGRAVTMDLAAKRNFESVFHPGKYVFFMHLKDGDRLWLSVQRRTN